MLKPDSLVCRGGRCLARHFQAGTGVSQDENGILCGISVNCGDADLLELSKMIPNRQVGVTTVEQIERSGGHIELAPSSRNAFHCVLSGLTAKQAEALFTPTQTNPNRID